MTDENNVEVARRAQGAGDEAGRPLIDITSMIHEIESHIDLHDAGEKASHLLASARSALKSALQYVEAHFASLEAAAVAEVQGFIHPHGDK